ncbi:MAG: hypothetical protein ACREIF_00610 [Chthoniobacterales bacterium]
MPTRASEHRLEEDISIHIFTVSAGMVGVCLTVIGLLRVVITLRKTDTFADDLLAMDAMLFLISCLTSYWALRTRSAKRMYRLERFADVVFVLALVVMAGACLFVTYAIAILK